MRILLGIMSLIIFCSSLFAEVPEHFYNDPKNINSDPDYAPGDYPALDASNAKTAYYIKRTEIIQSHEESGAELQFILGLGEVTFTSIKNESAQVLGYFRNYFGVAQIENGEPKNFELLIDVNSLDTAVPGRNWRILKIFFQSMMPTKGVIHIQFDQIKKSPKTGFYRAEGEITLNGVTKPILAEVKINRENKTWVIENTEPIIIQMSDFGYTNGIMALLKECNHKSIGNKVTVNVKLHLR